jgi:tetraacyldisaccharide 4'-kinase
MITDFWYKPRHFLKFLLLPFSWFFGCVVEIRHLLYQTGFKKTCHFSIPVIVVGNITVGGTGKTPFVIQLARMLQERGYQPGIISRGYGVKKIKKPKLVTLESHFSQVGDEPLVMAKHLNCPIAVCADKVLAVHFLLENFYCNVVISDDGLQNYHLGRSVEIALVDGKRLFGNRCYLPAGPLREPIRRLEMVDFVVYHRGFLSSRGENIFQMQLKPGQLTSVVDFQKQIDVKDLVGTSVHAVAGIGHPDRFFDTLKMLCLNIITHSFRDHYQFKQSDIDFGKDAFVIMTEKDAVKCQEFADHRHWFLPMVADFNQDLVDQIIGCMNIYECH